MAKGPSESAGEEPERQEVAGEHRRTLADARGWTTYFRHGVSKATFAYVHQFTWLRVVGWLRRKHRRANWRFLRRRYLANRWWPEHDGMALFDCRQFR